MPSDLDKVLSSFGQNDSSSEKPTPEVSSPDNSEPEASADIEKSDRSQVRQYPCSSCGAEVVFDPGTSSMKCPYCQAETELPQNEERVEELDFEAFLKNAAEDSETEEVNTRKCDSCGAEASFAPGEAAGECPFCGSPVIVQGGTTKQIRPRGLLPFKITRKKALSSFREWIHGLWFAPNKLKKYARHDAKLDGVYVPYWTYDCVTVSHYTGQRGEHYWVTEHYTTMVNGKSQSRTRRVRKTRWYPASGVVKMSFDDILVLASRSLPRKYADKLEPWDLENVAAYSDDFLSGFKAQSYQVGLEEGFGQAREIMEKPIRNAIRADIGGDEQRIHTVNTSYSDITFKHLLLPVWISSYRYKERVFRFLVNARTGEVQGERPWSFWKITLAILGGLAIIGTIVAIILR